jgi:predicted alpha/beta superfamily hydrolase
MAAGLLFILIAVCVVYQACASVEVTVLVNYPSTSRQMYIRGSGCGLNWDSGVKMTSVTQTQWKASVKCTDAEVASNLLEIKALIGDADWMIGSNHHVSVTGNGTVTDNLYPWFYTYQGTTSVVKNVYSPELKNSRDVIIYYPPSFKENTLKRYNNVLIMHDGQNVFDPRTSAFGCWYAQNALDSSIVGGTSDEILVVAPYNTPDRMNEYTYVYDESEDAGGKGDLYLDWIESTLIPMIAKDDQYRADISRDTLGILGSSLGGLISCYAGWTRPSVYGKVGCMSSSFWWADEDFENVMMPSHDVPSAPHSHIYMDSGTGSKGERDCTQQTASIYDVMVSDGFKGDVEIKKYVQDGGQHDEASWSSRFYIPVQFLYPSTTV